MPVTFCKNVAKVMYQSGAEWGFVMTVVELARNEEMLAAIYERIQALVDSGKSKEDAVAHVSAEVDAFLEVAGSAHFALNEAILQSRLTTGEWEDPLSSDDLLKKYLPN